MNISDNYRFNVALKTFPTEGNLVYEYNPLYNYRLNSTMIYYKLRLMEVKEFCKDLGISEDDLKEKTWKELIPPSESFPIVYLAGLLVDFETNELLFSLNNPVNIIPLQSYDNSVNLIINDGLNPPRLINSRFSATEKNRYLVCNRKGNNDSNIYDLGELFDIDTSLYKKMNTIPKLRFLGVNYGGNLSIGNYHFYLRYVDEDGNESDFFAESGLVSIFIGNSADSIHSGFRELVSHKYVKFLLSNTDAGYTKVSIYYTRSSSDIYQNATVLAKKILLEYRLNDNGNTIINITGFEDTQEVPIEDINTLYLIYGSSETQAAAQNMLFLGNVDKPNIPYEDLADCALRFLPILDCSETYPIDKIKLDYSGSITNTYYDPNYIYNKLGYWDDEIYRLGIVFIQKDNTLTEVFNVRGGKLKETTDYNNYTLTKFKDGDNRVYINYDENYYSIIDTSDPQNTLTTIEKVELENAKGTIHIDHSNFSTVIGLNFIVPVEVVEYLRNDLGIKGFFLVRQKRMPTTLCQAYTIGIDKESHTPVLPIGGSDKPTYITESFLTLKSDNFGDKKVLSHDFDKRKYTLEPLLVLTLGAICPEYDVNSPYLNTLFSASELVCRNYDSTELLLRDGGSVHFYPEIFKASFKKSNKYTSIKVIGVEDNTKLVAINDNMFSARAGEAEEAFRFEYIGKKNVNQDATNLLRGSYGPFLGITGYSDVGHIIDIKIPGFSSSLMDEYFKIRYNDKSAYYAISDRYSFNTLGEWTDKKEEKREEKGYIYKLKSPVYRGDCYICLFTHRLNRNFQDPTSPTNDLIVDPKCWKNNFAVSDGVVKKENFEKINLGDINAVMLGMYVTLVVRSTMNLNVRALDDSIPDEVSLFGHPRGFFPYFPMTTKGTYKIPEGLCCNKGFEKSLSERCNFEVPNVPWIKNEFSNRIAYSNILVLDAFLNGWRTFIGTHYRDYPKTYGSIVKLLEFRGNLLCIFEHGIALIAVNERAVAGEGAGGNVFINTSNVLPENPKVISDTYGSLWRDSVIKTPRCIYGVDTIGKKIWRTNGEIFECISDIKILEFLNKNISLNERELEPIIGIRNVKAHYNKFKGDVMFTFYDNLYGFEEKVWNICWNEASEKWITFYSWVPSYSENIYNQYFSFDRNTSKWIAKLGISNSENKFSDGIVLSNNVIPNNSKNGDIIGYLSLANRTLPEGDGIKVSISYELEKDNFKNYENFGIDFDASKGEWYLYLKTDASNLCSELFVRGSKSGDKYEEIITDPAKLRKDWLNNCVYNSNYCICKDDRGRRINLGSKQYGSKLNENKLVLLLNIKANIKAKYIGGNNSLAEAYATGFTNGTEVDAGYYLSVVAVIPKYNMQFLTTDFWKHGQSGIIDIADKIYPTYWYGKQHPFEFEFVVADNPLLHKIFDDLEIISNNAEPESFHYEIIGDCYDFAKDKKNMYIRLEATKELYLNNGYDVLYDHDYIKLKEELRPLIDSNGKQVKNLYDKSTIFPLYYSRQDTFNEIEDYYHLKENIPTKNFSALAGAEIVRYENLDEYRIWNHAKAVDINNPQGRLRGNMQYKEDKWNILINPINLVLKNESAWRNGVIPIELGQSPIPNDVLENSKGMLNVPENSKYRDIIVWKWQESSMKEVKPKDKWMKVRIRYSGKQLAVITAIKTLYSASYA